MFRKQTKRKKESKNMKNFNKHLIKNKKKF